MTRTLAILAVGTLLTLGLVTPSQAAEAGRLIVNVQAIPTTARPGEQVTIQGTVLNDSSREAVDVAVTLRVQREALSTRSAVQAWETSRNVGAPTGPSTLTLPVTGPAGVIPAQGSAPWTLTLPSDTLGLTTSGSRGIVLQATSSTSRGALRTYLTWNNGGFSPTRLTSIAAVSGPAAASVQEATEDLPITWVQDPSTQEDTIRAGTVTLPEGDPDLVALSRVPGSETLLKGGSRLLAWPDGADQGTLDWIKAQRYQNVVLPDTILPAPEQLSYTPSGHSLVPTRSGDLSAIVYDTTLSSLATTDRGTPAERSQRIVAELATLALERPNAPRNIVVALPRSWQADAGSGSVLRNLTSNPWVETSTILDAQGSEPVQREPFKAGVEGVVPSSSVRSALSVQGNLDRFAKILINGDDLTDPIEASILQVVSVSARSGDVSSLKAAAQDLNDLTSKVSVVPGSNINLATSEADLPISVYNGLSVPIQVRLDPRGTRPLLRFAKTGTQRIEAGQTKRLSTPVKAITNGNVSVVVNLVNTSGESVTPPKRLLVRVRMGLETSLGIILGVTGLVFVLGLYRNLKRGKRRTDEVTVNLDEHGKEGEEDPTSADTPAKLSAPEVTPQAGEGASPDAEELGDK